MSAITAKASRKMKKYAVLTREPRCFLGSFDFSWEQRKLGDIADIVGGGTPSTGNQSYWDGDIDWYAPAEIADQIYANSSQKKITGLGYENSSAKMLPPGTVLFTSRAGIGKTAILTRKGCTNQGFQSIVPHRGELDSYFIFSRTEELKRYGELVVAGSTFVEVSGKQMAVMELMMPPTMREQQTIGGFFQQLDNLITLHQRKFEKLTNVKKSMLEKMFPQNGSSYPEIRFKGFTDPWEQRKLGELGTITTGSTPSTSIPDYYSDDGIVWVTPTDICENITFESARKLSDLGQQVGRVVPKNTILVTCIASIGKNTMLGNTGSFNQQINGLTPNENECDPYFLLTESALWSAKMKSSAAAGTMQIVNRTEFSELKTWLPSLIEQQAISDFFRQLDNLITLHQRELEKLQNIKKSMLEKMFV